VAVSEELILKIIGDSAEFQKELDKVKKSSSEFGGSLFKILKAAIPTAAITGAFALVLKAYKDQEQAEQRIRGVIAATGAAAGVSAKQVFDLANKYEQLSIFDDNAIMSGQAVLLTFKGATAQFERATKASIDLAAVMGSDVKGAATLLGKALADPANAVAALTRAHVSLSKEQKQQIELFTLQGDKAKAQEVIFKALEGSFGGVAEQMSKGTGAFDLLRKTIGNLQEDIGRALAPEFVALANIAIQLVQKIRDNSDEFLNYKAIAIGTAASVLKAVSDIGERISLIIRGLSLLREEFFLPGVKDKAKVEEGYRLLAAAAKIGVDQIAKDAQEAGDKAFNAVYERDEKYKALQEKVANVHKIIQTGSAANLAAQTEYYKELKKLQDEHDKLVYFSKLDASQKLKLIQLDLENEILKIKEDNFKKEVDLDAKKDEYRTKFLLEKEGAFLDLKKELFQKQIESEMTDEEVLTQLKIQRETDLTQFKIDERTKRLSEEAGYYNSLSLLTDDQQKKFAIREDAFGKNVLKTDKLLGQARLGLITEGLTTVGDAYVAFGGKNVAIVKSLQIAEIVINGFSKGFQAFAELAPIPIIGIPLGIIAAGLVATQAATAIQKVTSAKFNPSGLASGSSGFSPTVKDPVMSLFNPREIVVPTSFSEGIRRGDLALVGSNDENADQSGGRVAVEITLKDDASRILQAASNRDQSLGLRGSIF